MLAQHHRAFPQRQALSTVLHDSGIKRRMGNGTAGGCGDDHAQVISPVTVPEFNLECSYKIDVMQVRIGEFSKSPVYTVVKNSSFAPSKARRSSRNSSMSPSV